jgi:hypothetical protein
MTNFDKYRQNLKNFEENAPKIGILSPGITTSDPGIGYRRKMAGIPVLTPLLKRLMNLTLNLFIFPERPMV